MTVVLAVAVFAARFGALGPEVLLQELRLGAAVWDDGWRSLSLGRISLVSVGLTRSSSEGVELESVVTTCGSLRYPLSKPAE